MLKRLLTFLVGALSAALIARVSAQTSPVALPPGVSYVTSVEGINEYRLANGLRVVLFADPTKTNITVNVTYMVGSRHEDYGETGMAHLLEHLLFKGSTKHPDIPKELTDHGTRPNGTTWFDRTNYFETFTATEENLRWALDLEADRMVNSFIAKKDLDSEFTVVRNEFEAGENSPTAILEERTISTAFLWHNYGKSTIGARSDIENVPIERLQAFYRHFYQPDNALLVVAGKIDEARTLQMIHQYFSPIPQPARQLRRTYTSEPTQDGERYVTLRRVGDVQALCIVHHIPSGVHEEYIAADMASDILGDQPSGRLYKALVEAKKAASVRSSTMQLKEPGVHVVMASVRTENSLDEARKAVTAVFDEIKTKPFTGEEVERARTQSLKQFEQLLRESQFVALTISNYQAMGDWRLLFLTRDRLHKVTREQVQKAAEKYFVSSNRTIGEFHPEKNPVRAEIPPAPDAEKLLQGYKSDVVISQGEEFDPSPANIDKRTIRAELAGGLKLSFINKKTRGNQVNALVNLRFGDVKSLQGQSMIASLTGQMLMRGTAKRTRQQIKDEFDKLKATVSVVGGSTSASASIVATRENLKAVLDLAAEILREPSFPPAEFDQLKQQSLAQMESMKSEPQMLAMTAMQRHVSPYPKGDPRHTLTVDERIEELKSITLDQVREFHKKFYGASNGEIVIIGDFDSEDAQKQMAGLFNNWKSPQRFQLVTSPYQPAAAKKEAFETPDKANAFVGIVLPLRMRDTDPDYPALAMANYLLGGSGLNSRLFARIRGKEGLSYGVGSNLSGSPAEDRQIFMAFAICAPQNAPKVEAAFLDELKSVGEKGFTAAEVEAAKKSWLQSRQVSRANDRELLSSLGMQRLFNRTMAFDIELEKKMQSLTAEQVTAALKKYLDPAAMSYFRGGDFKKANVTF
jgi:zinc protease